MCIETLDVIRVGLICSPALRVKSFEGEFLMRRKLYRNTWDTARGKDLKRLGAYSALDRASPEPLYRQIAHRLRAEIEAGRLAAGSRLPSVRELARGLGVNLVTVVTAYRDLIQAGLASGQVGRGTFVRAREAPPDRPEASPAEVPGEAGGRWDPAAVPQSRAAMHLKLLDRNVVALNSGLPSADFFPLVAFRRALEAVLRREGSAALQYQPMEGNGPLREAIAAYLEGRGTPVRPEDVLICSGAVSGVHIAARFLAMPGDVLLTENPVYCGFLSALEILGVRLVGIPVDDEGMRVDMAERLIRQYRPKAIYTIPTYNNPTGVCLSLDRRQALLSLSRREGVPIIEEDYANEIGFTGPPPPTLKAMDGAGQIIHVKSFAKLVFPSIRIAAIVAPASMIRGLLGVKEGIDPYASGLNQLVLHESLAAARVLSARRRAGGQIPSPLRGHARCPAAAGRSASHLDRAEGRRQCLGPSSRGAEQPGSSVGGDRGWCRLHARPLLRPRPGRGGLLTLELRQRHAGADRFWDLPAGEGDPSPARASAPAPPRRADERQHVAVRKR
jgi:DNA-binding transcriptional MocR family regulator